ncbi:Putative alpha/beta hydrolase-1 [Septoria linicola]|uniref:Alpha/beta hydrolase-1 n=1 Tax=Septoria linicola TaxID=215465 RepID=A0A9Q9EGK4_9PEZI|nr:putative alpha/beta hydrolase-1 [Septoria linicola]USW48917.1 Putative alpha/beta hydrolase-1 [Septoria linicola]
MEKYRTITHKVPAAHLREFPRATAHSEEDVLHFVVKQYIPLDNPDPQPGDVTIIAAHAVGFNKELYEPLWDELAAQAERQGWRIRSIWMADTAWHGESYALNEDLLGNDPGWYDHPRDLANLINLKRAEMPRPLIGVGHSMGGNQVTKLALDHPSLFTSLILIDPVIQMKSAEITPGEPNAAKSSTFRRSVWPSREEAKASFLKSAYYQIWDPRVLDKWVQHGLRDCPNPQHPNAKAGEVSLATPPAQEVWSFLRPNYEGHGYNGTGIDRFTHPDVDTSLPNQIPFYRSEPIATYRRLPELRPSCLYIFGEKSFVCDAARAKDKVARTGIGAGGSGGEREGRVKGVTYEGIGHLIAMEVPKRTAETLAEWVGKEMMLYREQRKKLEEWWKKPLHEKQVTDKAWIDHMGGPPKRRGAAESKI